MNDEGIADYEADVEDQAFSDEYEDATHENTAPDVAVEPLDEDALLLKQIRKKHLSELVKAGLRKKLVEFKAEEALKKAVEQTRKQHAAVKTRRQEKRVKTVSKASRPAAGKSSKASKPGKPKNVRGRAKPVKQPTKAGKKGRKN